VGTIPGLLSAAAGLDANGAATLAYSELLTPTGSLTPMQELFTSSYSSTQGAWSAPTQLTNDAIDATMPQVIYNESHQPLVVWLEGATLSLRNLATGSLITQTLPSSLVSPGNMQVVRDGSGTIAAVLTVQTLTGRSLYVARYDATHNLWGEPAPLVTDPVISVQNPSSAFDPSGRLLTAYASTARITQLITDTSTGQTITGTLPADGQTDIVALAHVFTSSLTMTDTDLALNNPTPLAGQSVTVSATVHNTGDMPLDGVSVGFYDGDPALGGTLIATNTLTAPLVAQTSAVLTTTYTPPGVGGPRTLVAIAAATDSTAMLNGSGYVAHLAAFGPDLQVTAQPIQYAGGVATLTTLVSNLGTSAAPATTLVMARDAITGMPVLTVSVPSLQPGQMVTVTTPYTIPAGLAAGSYPLVESVNQNQADFAEANTANNSASVTLLVAPDLIVDATAVTATLLPNGQVAISTSVRNASTVSAPPSDLSVYLDVPFSTTTLITNVVLPSLAGGVATTVSTTWVPSISGAHTLYAVINASNTVTETRYDNNGGSADITLGTTSLTTTLALQSGWNPISLPLTPTTPLSARAVIQGLLATTHGSVAELASWTGNSWTVVLPTTDPSQDFSLSVGQGYFLYSDAPGAITITGTTPASSPSLALQAGWNLIGAPSATGVISASTLLTSLSAANLAPQEVASWLGNSWQVCLQASVCTPDFVVAPGQGYFVYLGASGAWQARAGSPAHLAALRQPHAIRRVRLPSLPPLPQARLLSWRLITRGIVGACHKPLPYRAWGCFALNPAYTGAFVV